MLKYKLCRICMKQRKLNTGFVKIFESMENGGLVSNMIINFANVSVDQNDGLPHIICNHCFETLIKYSDFQKMIVQNDKALSELSKKPPNEVEQIITQPLIRIEKLKKSEESTIVHLDTSEDIAMDDPFPSQNSSSDSEDDFPMEEASEELIEAVKPRFLCCCCPFQFNEEHEILEHMKNDHADIRSKLNIVPVDKDPRYVKQCELCLKYVYGFAKLIEHQNQYQNCKQCVECGGFYQNKGKIHCQCKRPHEPKPSKNHNVDKVKCDLCFSLVRDIKAHNYYQHADKIMKCKECDFATYQKHKMVRHATKHLEKKVPCPYAGCGKMFVSSNCAALKLHMNRHTGEKKYDCKFCGKSFADNSDCKRHEWQHTGVSPYMCSKCNKMFLRKNHLLSHEEKCAR